MLCWNKRGASWSILAVLFIFIELSLFHTTRGWLPSGRCRRKSWIKESTQSAILPTKRSTSASLSISSSTISDNMERIDLLSVSRQEGKDRGPQTRRSLAADYLVEILPRLRAETSNGGGDDDGNQDEATHFCETWTLTPLQKLQNSKDELASGALATAALYQQVQFKSDALDNADGTIVLEGRVLVESTKAGDGRNEGASKHLISINCRRQPAVFEMDANTVELVSTLSRVMVHRLTSQYHSFVKPTTDIDWHLQLPRHEEELIRLPTTGITDQNIRQLFSSPNTVELVEMVCSQGQAIGTLPRNLIHTFNILHRGIGLFVTKDSLPQPFWAVAQVESDVPSSAPLFPDLYIHRRTSWKRIFPSLYDMFVGGISLAGEDSITTARREVAEELGLVRETALSPPLLACTICTSYNRCVVTLFCYVMDSVNEKVSWQQEEVAWGDFVPYAIVEASADLSIQRLVETNAWPGTYPPRRAGPQPEHDEYDTEDWTTWDFVPDGLLVWEAWLRHLSQAF